MWVESVDRFLAELDAAGQSAETRKLRAYQLRRFAADHPDLAPRDITRDHLIAWLTMRQWSAETRRSYRATVRRFFAWACAAGVVGHDPAATLPAIRPPRALPRPAPDDALADALAGADDRVRLMIELIAATGMRRGELARLHADDAVLDAYGHCLRITGKGGHVRLVPVPAMLARLVGEAGGYVFPGRIDGHLSARRVGELIADALPGRWTAHTLRHRFATRAYAVSHDLRGVQELLGHAKPETTAIYTQVAPGRLHEISTAAWRPAAAAA